MKKELEIDKPKPEDIQQILDLYEETWLDTYPSEEHGISLEDLEDRMSRMKQPEQIEKFSKRILEKDEGDDTKYFRVAKDGEKVLGVCGGYEKEDVVHMASLYVFTKYQGQGVGGQLMQAFLDWANPEKPVRVHVVTYNQKAISFYEKWGFRDNGERFSEERFIMKSGNAFPEMEMVRESK